MADKGAGKKVKSGIIADWDASVTVAFCEICVEEIEAGNRPHGNLSAKGYQNLIEKFAARTGRPYTQKQHKNRWDALKGLYDFWLSLNNTTGIGWNSDLNTYSASDEFWENNTKRNKERRAIRFGPPANLKLLEKMFDKSKVSGLSACIPGQPEATNLCDSDDAELEELLTIPTGPGTRGAKRKGRKSPSPKKKLKNPMVRVMTKMVDDVISTNSITSKAIQGDFVKEEIHELMNLAKEAGAVEGSDEHYIATRLFVKSENRSVFQTLETNEGRLNWLKRCFEDRKK